MIIFVSGKNYMINGHDEEVDDDLDYDDDDDDDDDFCVREKLLPHCRQPTYCGGVGESLIHALFDKCRNF